MQVPTWSNRNLGTAPLRTVDLFATILDWTGVSIPAGLDSELVGPAAGTPVAIPAADG
jgi:hypothetical protein